MRFLSTFILFILVVSLGAYIFFYEKNTASTSAIKKSEIYLFDVSFPDLDHLYISDIALNKELQINRAKNKKWNITYPSTDVVDMFALKQVLSQLATARIFRILENNPAYGLASPSKKIVFGTATKEEVLYVGNNASLDGMHYVKKEGIDNVYSVSSDILKNLEANIDLFRDKRMFSLKKDAIASLYLSYDDKYIGFVADENLYWEMNKPFQAKVEQRVITNVLKEIEKLKVEDFIMSSAEAIDRFGLANPRGEMIGADNKGVLQKIILGNTDDKYLYFLKEGFESIGKIDKNKILKYLKANVNLFRSRTFFDLYPFEVNELVVVTGGNTSRLYKDQVENEFFWYLEDKDKSIYSVEIDKVRKCFTSLRKAEIINFDVNQPDSNDLDIYGITGNNYLKISTDNTEMFFYSGKIDIEKEIMYVRIASENSIVSLPLTVQGFFKGFEDDFFETLKKKKHKKEILSE